MPKKFFTSKIIRLISAIVICLLLVFFSPGNFLSPVRGLFLKIVYPFEKTFYIAGQKTNNFFSLISSISECKEKNINLIKENNELQAQIDKLKDQKKENEELRRQLELSPRDKYQLESSLVIGQDPRRAGSWIIIDRGKNNGIEKGMPVIVFNSILIGKVDEVYDNSAKVVLLSDASSVVNVSDVETSARGILSGEYGLGLKLSMVEQAEILNVGDDVVTSGLGGSMPKGLLVGKIEQISNSPDKLFQEAVILPKVKYSNLNIVFVIKEEKNYDSKI